jgi:hypothetical protein
MSYAAVGGGQQNKADGRGSTIPGGEFNTAAGDYSFAAGLLARASHDGSFVWADKDFDTAGFGTTGENQFLIRAKGGVGIGTETPTSQLTVHGMIESDSLGFKFPDGSIQTSAAAGGGGGYWSLMGNTGTDPSTNFIGTIDSTAFEIRMHNKRVVRIEPGVAAIGTNAPNVIMGDSSNAVVGASIAGATIGGGGGYYIDTIEPNTVSASFTTISGGHGNAASGGGATIGGGRLNVAGGGLSTVGGGYENQATGNVSVVGGGYQNYATASNSFVGAGFQNVASANNAFVGAGSNNGASGIGSVVGGGTGNHARQTQSFVGGGDDNDADADYAAISGGRSNEAIAPYAFVGGGQANVASGDSSTVGGGRENTASGQASTVAGGGANQASGQNSSIGGGRGNQATMSYSTVAGGSSNLATQNYGSVLGGWTNWVDSEYGSVGGGFNNITQGNFATIPGGYQNAADGHSSFAAGYKARALHEGSFVWNDRSVTTFPDMFESTDVNQFLIRAAGGVGIGTNAPEEQLHIQNPGGGSGIKLGGSGTDGPHGIIFDDDVADAGVQLVWRTSPNQLILERTSAGTGTSGTDAFSYDRDNDHFLFDGTIGVGTSDPRAAVTVQGPNDATFGPTLYFRGDASDQVESGRIRFVEATGSGNWRGAYIHYDGSGNNDFHIGVHNPGDASTASDLNVITIHRNSGDLGIRNENPGYSLHVGTDGTNGNGAHVTNGGDWTNGSSRTFKTDFQSIDNQEILDQLASIPIEKWRYKDSDEGRHIGPVAEDFYDAFGLGKDNRYIGTTDAAGVSMAAIQALYRLVKEQQSLIQAQKERLDVLQARLE